jgi:hypothetical protein
VRYDQPPEEASAVVPEVAFFRDFHRSATTVHGRFWHPGRMAQPPRLRHAAGRALDAQPGEDYGELILFGLGERPVQGVQSVLVRLVADIAQL